MAVNSRHNNDTSWLTYMQRLSGNAVRMCVSFLVIGADLTGAPVTSLATFSAAVTQLRTYAGHTPGQAAPGPTRPAGPPSNS